MLLTAKWVIPVATKPFKDGAILVKRGKIQKVGKKGELKKAYADEDVYDFKNAVLLPGFVDTHTHVEYSVFRGLCDDLPFTDWKMQLTKRSRKLSSPDWQASARLGVLEAISSGITSIADITKTGASLEAAKEAGLRGIIFYEVSGMDHKQIDKIISKAKRDVKSWKAKCRGTKLKVGVSPYSVYTVTPPLFKAVSEWARKDKLIVSLHLAGSKDEYKFVKYGSSSLANQYRELMGWEDILWQPTGVSPIKYLEQWDTFESGPVVAVHCVQIDKNDLDILEKYDLRIVHCPKCSAKLGMGVAPLLEFINRGLKVGLGTDSPASNNTMDLIDEMRTGILMQRGEAESVENLSAELFINIATLGGAQVLEMGDKIGSLEEGKQADIIGVDLSSSHQRPVRDPYSALVYTASQENVIFTMVGGKILFNRGDYSSLNPDEILSSAEPVRSKIRQ